ncbi:MAG: alcohol dehydrogenase catalytic domain-containing protein [Acidobacteriota bacterium]
MQALTFQAPGDVRVERAADPRIEAPGDVLVRVEVAGLCGSDLHPYRGREEGLDPGTVMGHELVGEVVEAGVEVERFRPGDRVVAPPGPPSSRWASTPSPAWPSPPRSSTTRT